MKRVFLIGISLALLTNMVTGCIRPGNQEDVLVSGQDYPYDEIDGVLRDLTKDGSVCLKTDNGWEVGYVSD